ncbi:MAG TPA: TonB-dependent receptor, partial [Longimicrobiaceae bacterium]|nr:TonB-dependent receptor [Longimicrobiaceae bacterium]
YLSLGSLSHDGYIVTDNDHYSRNTVRFNGAHQVLSNLTVGANAAYVQTEGGFVQRGNSINGLLLGALRQPPEFDAINYLDPTTGLHRSWRFQRPGATAFTNNRGFDNPFYALNEGKNTLQSGRVYGNVNLDWRPLDWLKVNYTLGADYAGDDRLEARPFSSAGQPVGGSVIRWQFTDRILDHNLVATADYTLAPWFSGSVSLGQNLNEQKFRQVFVQGNTLISPEPLRLDNTVDRNPPTDAETITRSEGYFAQASADLWDQLFLTASLRNDGSSTFGEDNQRAWYPKASAAWTFTDAFTPPSFLSYGKVRLAYGETGQQPGAYLLQDVFTNAALVDFNPGSVLTPTLGGLGGLYSALARGNSGIEPERQSEIETGIDLAFFDERADVSVTYYDQHAEDVIYNVPQPASTGFTSQTRNAAEIENHGWEVTLNLRPVRTKDFNVEFGFNWARNENELVSLGDSLITVTGFNIGSSFAGSTTNSVVGEPLGVFRGTDFVRCGRGVALVSGNAFNTACAGQAEGTLYIGANGFPVQDPTDQTIGDPNPDWTGGVNASVQFRRLRLSAFLDVRRGGQTLNMTRSSLYQYGTHKDTENRATCTAAGCTGNEQVFGQDLLQGPTVGPGAGTAVAIGQPWYEGLGGVGGPRAQFMEDASFTRLREVTAAISFDDAWVRRVGLSNIEVAVSGRNLKLWSDYSGLDPEINAGGAGAANRGVDWFVNPLSRAWVFSMSLNR